MIVLWLVMTLSATVQQTAQPSQEPTQARSTPDSACRAEYQRLMTLLDQTMARLNAADRAQDVRAMRAAVIDARRVVANVKARAAACGASERADPSRSQAERNSSGRTP